MPKAGKRLRSKLAGLARCRAYQRHRVTGCGCGRWRTHPFPRPVPTRQQTARQQPTETEGPGLGTRPPWGGSRRQPQCSREPRLTQERHRQARPRPPSHGHQDVDRSSTSGLCGPLLTLGQGLPPVSACTRATRGLQAPAPWPRAYAHAPVFPPHSTFSPANQLCTNWLAAISPRTFAPISLLKITQPKPQSFSSTSPPSDHCASLKAPRSGQPLLRLRPPPGPPPAASRQHAPSSRAALSCPPSLPPALPNPPYLPPSGPPRFPHLAHRLRPDPLTSSCLLHSPLNLPNLCTLGCSGLTPWTSPPSPGMHWVPSPGLVPLPAFCTLVTPSLS